LTQGIFGRIDTFGKASVGGSATGGQEYRLAAESILVYACILMECFKNQGFENEGPGFVVELRRGLRFATNGDFGGAGGLYSF